MARFFCTNNECETLSAAASPGSTVVPIAITPVIVPVSSPVAAMPPMTSMIIKSVRVPTITDASPVPIVVIGFSAWSTSIHATFAGVVTVHKLSAFLFTLGIAPVTSLCLSLVRTADEDQKRQAPNHEKLPKGYELHKLTLRYLT